MYLKFPSKKNHKHRRERYLPSNAGLALLKFDLPFRCFLLTKFVPHV